MASAAVLLEGGLDPREIGRLKSLKASLLPLYESLPKNEHGKLQTDVARYALHRLFEQQHDYSVNGLHSGGNTQQENLFGHLAADVKPEGVSMNDLALLAMLLEHRIHQETVERVTELYVEQNRSTSSGELSMTEMDALVERYMMFHVAGFSDSFMSSLQFPKWTASPDGVSMLAWIHYAQQESIKKQMTCTGDTKLCSFDFQATCHVVEDILKSYGGFHHKECQHLKSSLLASEHRKTGRVALADFYRTGRTSRIRLNEKAKYLRDLGALDESVLGQARVIVVNYVNARSNCMHASSMYSVCCRNECEDLMGHLERNIKAPTATPALILQLVDAFMDSSHDDDMLSSKGSVFNKIASKLHEDRLDNIAAQNGGEVPLHGRLLAQWLHHVVPQKCAFPHASGTTNPLTPQEWMNSEEQQAGGRGSFEATEEEILQMVTTDRIEGNATYDELDRLGEHNMPWSDEEEVFTIRPHQATMQTTPRWRSNILVILAMTGVISWLKPYVEASTRKSDKYAV